MKYNNSQQINILLPIRQVLANRYVDESDGFSSANGSNLKFDAHGKRNTFDLIETINVNIKGTIMPWPLFSEKVDSDEANRRALEKHDTHATFETSPPSMRPV